MRRSMPAFAAMPAIIVLAACQGASPPTSSIAAEPSAMAAASVQPSALAGEPYAGAQGVIPVAAGPRGVAVADGSVWVASTIGNSLQRVDPATNQVIAEIRLDRPVTLVTLGDELWVSVLNADSADDDQVVRIDTSTDAVAAAVDVPVFHNIAAGAGAVWAVDGAGELRRIDPASGVVTSAATVGGMTQGLAANDAAVWGIREGGTIWRLPSAGGELREAPLDVAVPGRSRVGVAATGAVWVAVPGTVLALDPDDLTRQRELSLPGMDLVNDLWVTDTDAWLSANLTDADLGLNGGAILRLDPGTAEVVAAFPLGRESSGVVVAEGSLWAVDQRDNVLVRYRLDG